MANETRGILYETITEAALQLAVKKAKIQGLVRWNEKPKGMSVEPDFTVGMDKDDPSHVIMVTASGSSHNSHMKFWRNLGELQEVKAQLPRIPIVINLYFESVVKANILLLNSKLYDNTLVIGTKSYFKPLQDWVHSNIQNATGNKEERKKVLFNDIQKNRLLADSINKTADDLVIALKNYKSDLSNLWELMRTDFALRRNYRSNRITSVRRGLAKLMVLEPEIRLLVYSNISSVFSSNSLPEYIFELGFFEKTISGAHLVDEEIRSVIKILGSEVCEEMIALAPPVMNLWIQELRQLENNRIFIEYMERSFDNLTKRSNLLNFLNDCQNDPEGFAIKNRVNFYGELNRNWLFLFLLNLLKAHSGKLQGYSYSLLGDEMGERSGFGSGYMTIADWANRKPGTKLSEKQLSIMAEVLANRVKDVGKQNLKPLIDKVIAVDIKSSLEDRLIPYWKFESILYLLYRELDKQGVTYKKKTSYVGWVSEYTAAKNRSGTTPFVQIDDTLIHWKSSYTSHVHDKTKELSARARNIRYQFDSKTKAFSRRKGVNRLALIVDGDWTEANLRNLANAGWDIIVYPDEIPDLVSQLKRH